MQCDLLHVVVTVVVAMLVQGWTDIMYMLMSADYAPLAAFFSMTVIVVVSFLGLQLFTSVLCTSSLEVRYVACCRMCPHCAVCHAPHSSSHSARHISRRYPVALFPSLSRSHTSCNGVELSEAMLTTVRTLRSSLSQRDGGRQPAAAEGD
jgi:hypothetical protein